MDESGFSLIPPLCRTWAPVGKTPCLKHRFTWPKLSAISGVDGEGNLYLRLVRGTINGAEVIRFLRVLLRHIRGAVMVVWDNIRTHRSAEVRRWITEHPRLSVEYLPAYAPELNADEGVWQYLKRNVVGNYCAASLDELESEIRHGIRLLQRRPALVHSFIKQTGLK